MQRKSRFRFGGKRKEPQCVCCSQVFVSNVCFRIPLCSYRRTISDHRCTMFLAHRVPSTTHPHRHTLPAFRRRSNPCRKVRRPSVPPPDRTMLFCRVFSSKYRPKSTNSISRRTGYDHAMSVRSSARTGRKQSRAKSLICARSDLRWCRPVLAPEPSDSFRT